MKIYTTCDKIYGFMDVEGSDKPAINMAGVKFVTLEDHLAALKVEESPKPCTQFSDLGDRRCVLEISGDFFCGEKPCMVLNGRRAKSTDCWIPNE